MSKLHKMFALSMSSLILAAIVLTACADASTNPQDPDAFRREMEAQKDQRERERMIHGIR